MQTQTTETVIWCDHNESDANTPAHYANVYFNHFIGGKASHDTSEASFRLLCALVDRLKEELRF